MEEQIASLVELRKSVKRAEHESNYCESYRNSAYSCKLKYADLIRILLKQDEYEINRCDNTAENIGQDRVKLEIAYTACLQRSLFGISREHQDNSHYRQSDNNEIQDKFRCWPFTVAHMLIINWSVFFFVPETVILGTNLCTFLQFCF